MFADTPAFSGFAVNDIEAAKAFYGDLLGIRVSEANGMLQLHLAGSSSSAGDRDTLIYPKADHVPATYTILNFPVPDIEAAVDALVAKGIVFQHSDWLDERGINRHGGPLIAWFADPAGNILSVLEQ